MRIILYICPYFLILFLVADYMVMEGSLPHFNIRLLISCFTGHTGLKLPNNLSKIRFPTIFYYQNHMNMVWHYRILIHIRTVIMLFYLSNVLPYKRTQPIIPLGITE